MKHMQILKRTTILFALTVLGTLAFSQSEDAIALPDVTTVVSGGALTAGKDSVPDYTSTLPTVETATVALPHLDAPVETPAPEPEPPAERGDTRFRLGGGLYTGFPLGDDRIREKIAAVFAGEVPITTFATDKEVGAATHLLLGGVIGKPDVPGGFAGGLSLAVYVRIPLASVFLLQPSLGYGIVLTRADATTFFDSQLLLGCSARFVPQNLADGALEFALTPVLTLAPASDNAVCTLGFRLGALYSFR